MAKVLGIDVETTGLDVAKDRVIEIGAVVWDTEACAPLGLYSEFVNPGSGFLPLSEEVRRVTGIESTWVQSYGIELAAAMTHLEKLCKQYEVTHVVAHNGANYDLPLLLNELDRIGFTDHSLRTLPLLDTRNDLPFNPEPTSRRLQHLSADHDFLNPFKHRAVFDVLTMLKIFGDYDFAEVVAQASVPWVVMRALVSYDDRQKAKDLRFGWEVAGDKKYPKCWVKLVRENKVTQELEAAKALGVQVTVI